MCKKVSIMKDQLQFEDIKKLAYGVLENFKSVCERNDIYYILSFGTALGAVRHNGFIPWDDDIDVCVFRKDYQKLIEAYAKEKDSRYRLVSTEVDANYSLPHMKIIDTSTVLYQAGRRNNYPLGVWIDVFALDNVPDNLRERKKYIKKLERYQAIWSALEYERKKRSSSPKTAFKSIILSLISAYFGNNSRNVAIKLEKLAKRYEYDNTREAGVLPFFPYDRNKSIFPKELLENSVDQKFENDLFPIPKDYDSYLTHIYGDYMKLPPIEKQITHHGYTVSYVGTK